MTSPGGAEVGRVSIRVVPDTSGFRRELNRELKEIEESVELEIPLELNTAQARREVEQLRAELATLSDQTINIRVNERGGASSLSGIRAEIARINREGSALGNMLRNVFGGRSQNDMNLFQRIASTALGQFANLADASTKGLIRLADGIGDLVQNGMKGLLASVVQIVIQFSIWAPLITTLAGLIVYLGGAIAAALGGLPALLAGIGIPIAAIVLGFDGWKKAAEGLAPAFDKLKTSLSDTFEKTLTPSFNKLNKLMPIINDGMVQIARSISNVVKGFVDWAVSAEGISVVRNMLSGVNDFVKEMQPGLQRLFESLMNIAGVRQYYEILGDTFDNVFKRLARFFDEIRTSGQLEAGLRNLGDLLYGLTDLFAALLEGALQFFNAAAPGMETFIGGLTSFFERLDWERLGDAFGRIFGALGNWLMNLDQTTMDRFTDAMVAIANKIIELIQNGTLDKMVALFGGLFYAFLAILEITDQLFNFFDWITSIPQRISDAFNGFSLTGIGQGMIQSLQDGAGSKFIEFSGWLNERKLDIIGFFSDAWNWLTDPGNGLITGFSNGASQKWADFTGWLGRAKDSVVRFFSDAWNWIKNPGNWLFGGFGEGANQSWTNFIGWVGSIPGAIGDFFKNAGNWLVNAGRNVISGFLRGATEMWNSNRDWFASIAGWIGQHKGPLSYDRRLLIPAGRAIMQGLFEGLTDGWSDVQTLVNGMTQTFEDFGSTDLAAAMNVQQVASISSDSTSQIEAAASLAGNGIDQKIASALEGWTIEVNKYGVARLNKSAVRDNEVGR